MPLAIVAQADQIAAKESAGSDLQYHLAELGIAEDVQIALFVNGITSLRVFAGLDETREKIRECLKVDLGLDAADGMVARRQVALVISAWEAARVQVNAEDLARVEAKANALPRPVGTTELAAMRRVAEVKLGSLKGCEVPSKALIGLKLEQVEDNEPRVEDLREVSSLEDLESEALTGIIDGATGVFRVRKGSNSIPLPTNPEGLRLRHRRIGLAWTFVASRHTNRKWLAGVSVEDFRMLSDYILGARVAELTTRAPGGEVMGRVSWGQVLDFDHEVRKLAYELVRTGAAATISEGLKAAIKDSEVRQLHLMDPMTMSRVFGAGRGSGRRQAADADEFQASSNKARRSNPNQGGTGGGGKGKGKKGKGKKKGGLWSKTPAGALICYAFNNAGCPGGCTMQHVCQRCLGAHSLTQCTGFPAGGGPAQPARSLPDTGSGASGAAASGARAGPAGP